MVNNNIYKHVVRLNLDIPEHMKLHHYLMNLDPKKVKSKNEFMINVLIDSIEQQKARAEGNMNDSWHEEFLKEKIEEIKKEITKDVTNEILKTLLNMVVSKVSISPPAESLPVNEDDEVDDVDEALASAAYGYFDD